MGQYHEVSLKYIIFTQKGQLFLETISKFPWMLAENKFNSAYMRLLKKNNNHSTYIMDHSYVLKMTQNFNYLTIVICQLYTFIFCWGQLQKDPLGF